MNHMFELNKQAVNIESSLYLGKFMALQVHNLPFIMLKKSICTMKMKILGSEVFVTMTERC